jgi:hypothetical protein
MGPIPTRAHFPVEPATAAEQTSKLRSVQCPWLSRVGSIHHRLTTPILASISVRAVKTSLDECRTNAPTVDDIPPPLGLAVPTPMSAGVPRHLEARLRSPSLRSTIGHVKEDFMEN